MFFILQFLGNHSYFYNYEPEFERYLPNINNFSEKDKSNDSLYINAYDNTILYTDYILSEIIHTVKQQDAVSNMIFTSDIGVNISKNGDTHGGCFQEEKQRYILLPDGKSLIEVSWAIVY